MAEKKKMSHKKFMLITLPIMAILLGTVIAVTAVMNFYGATMDMYFGKGTMHTIVLEGTEDWDTDYYGTPKTAEESKAAAAEIAQKIGNEGVTLLKNNGVLPLTASDKITPLGRGVVDPIYGGSGSGNVDTTQDYIVTAVEALQDTFGNNLNTKVIDRLNEVLASDIYQRGSIQMFGPSTYGTGEFPAAEYASVENTIDAGSTALVFICRPGGEGGDLGRDMSGSGGTSAEHQLELDATEKGLIAYAKTKCENVVVILNLSTTMELGSLATDDDIDAILWVGSPGAKGFASMGDVLINKVNPSGRTVDTYAADFTKDPSWVNFGDFQYTNCSAPSWGGWGTSGTYIEYEEGIYVGYRYYETAASLKGEDWYNAWKSTSDKASGTGVVYPFGYGLSYTKFSQTIKDHRIVGGNIEVDVEVKNEGDVAGKEVVQVYYSAPYNAAEGIEKSYINLAAFAKTDILEPKGQTGDSEIVTVSFAIEDMASYDYKSAKAYVLSGGDYEIKLMKNAHEMWGNQSFKYNVPAKIVYDENNPRQSEVAAQSYMNADGSLAEIPSKGLSDADAKFVAATNRFEDLNTYMSDSSVTNLSRANWDTTFPTQGEAAKEAPQAVIDAFAAFDVETDAKLGNVQGSAAYHSETPESGVESNIKLIDLRGLNYYDEKWDLLLDQLTYGDAELKVTIGANYQTIELSDLGKPRTEDHDGPQGLTGTYGTNKKIDACAWCSEPLVAATFNVDLAYAMGETIGQEALALEISGWYGPAMNTHRSPFGGRNFEYYSEDGLLGGKMAAATVSGAGKSGLYAYIKHFALNDQETNRLNNIATWATEQAVREIYLKPFEICIKEAKCTIKYISDDKGTVSQSTMRAATAVMSSFNRIGGTLASESYALLTEVLRDEWGFTGMVITDMMGGLDYDKKLRAGNDLNMDGQSVLGIKDKSSDSAKWAYRNAIKNIFYTVVNSNSMAVNGIAPGTIFYYDMSGWAIGLLIGNIVIYLLILAGLVWNVLRFLDGRRHPDKYKSGKAAG